MAEKRFRLVEVVDGRERSDFEDSEDDYDGYLDMDEGDRDVCEDEGHTGPYLALDIWGGRSHIKHAPLILPHMSCIVIDFLSVC